MSTITTFVAFRLDDQRYALPFASVIRVVHIVEITPLPEAPPIVVGVINVAGSIVPVIDLRTRFGLPARGVAWTDQIVIARTSTRTIGLVVDVAEGLIEADAGSVTQGDEVLSHLNLVQGVLKLDDGLVVIHDLDRCLSIEEERSLSDALEEPD